uniref:Reverse transcriptase domain-containing protein n=1 Tax=viral metagenome TaxID=1070528 RepID=A0A6C0C7B7_9ZZZZ
MGALFDQDVREKETFVDMSDYSKFQIMEYIKAHRTKNINFPENFRNVMKMIELNNTKLLPMAMELYYKLFEIFGEYHNTGPKKNTFYKKIYFIKPNFSATQVNEKYKIDMEMFKIKQLTPFNDQLLQIKRPDLAMITADIRLDEYDESFNDVLAKKDMMGISKRILRDIPEYLKMRFINVYNRILHNPELIKGSCLSKGSYVYKVAKKGATDNINSFRPISSLPNVVNQFHRILNIRLSNYMLANKYLDVNIQKGGVSGQAVPIVSQYFKLKNVIKHANKNGKPCVVVFIDITNAFGSINKSVLYKILGMYNVDERLIRYLSVFYDNLEYYVEINSVGQLYKWGDGLIQGCSLSPLLFVIALNYILKTIDEKYKGVCGYDFTDKIKILLTAFMDDIAIVCNNVASAQLIFDDLCGLFDMLGLQINKEKCGIMTINEPTVPIKSLATIQKVDKYKYLGEYLTSNGDSSEAYAMLLTITMARLIRLNNNPKLDNANKIKMFETLILPQVQKKLMIMYDIGTSKRIKIASVIKTYVTKWGNVPSMNLFGDLIGLMSTSNDEVIQGIISENICRDDTLEHDIAISDYIFKNPCAGFGYGKVDDEFEVDAEIDALELIADN